MRFDAPRRARMDLGVFAGVGGSFLSKDRLLVRHISLMSRIFLDMVQSQLFIVPSSHGDGWVTTDSIAGWLLDGNGQK